MSWLELQSPLTGESAKKHTVANKLACVCVMSHVQIKVIAPIIGVTAAVVTAVVCLPPHFGALVPGDALACCALTRRVASRSLATPPVVLLLMRGTAAATAATSTAKGSFNLGAAARAGSASSPGCGSGASGTTGSSSSLFSTTGRNSTSGPKQITPLGISISSTLRASGV